MPSSSIRLIKRVKNVKRSAREASRFCAGDLSVLGQGRTKKVAPTTSALPQQED